MPNQPTAYLIVLASPTPYVLAGAAPMVGTPPAVGTVFTLLPGKTILGREAAPDIAILLPYPQVSRRNTQIDGDALGNWDVQDLFSRNGTLLNGQKLQPNAATPLMEGDRIHPAGSVEFLFTFVVPPPTPPPPRAQS